MNVFSRTLSTRKAKTAAGAKPTATGAAELPSVGSAAGTTTATKVAAKENPTTTKSASSTHKRQSTKRLKMNVLQKADNTISSPATPSPGTPVLHQHHQHYNNNNSSSSSSGIGISNNICGTPATPTHSPQYNQSGSISSGSSCSGSGINSVPPAPPLTPGTSAGGRAQVVYSSGHKNSLKGTKLARRARSFKDDLVEKFSLMRNTTNNTLGRSHSPHSPRNKHASTKAPPTAEEVAKSSQTLETHVKDISNALKHFRDVILKKKLEVLPGNGTVILETIASMYSVIQSYTLNEQSTVLLSATQQVYLSLGKLIKLCDEVMLSAEDSGECPSLNDANVREVVDLLEDAVRNLVTLAQQKLKEKDDCAFLYTRPALIGIGDGSAANRATTVSAHHLMRPQLPEVAGQRTSLPDITLTPKERDILEKTKSNPIRASHSTESILRDTSPPPKPPLPNRTNNPPPLPPKRRSHPNQHHQHHHHQPQQQQHHHQHHHHHHHQQQHHHHPQQQHSNNISINSDLDCSSDFSLLNYGVDHLSVRSRSPDENSSQCSLDSALNHSREEEELKLLRSESRLDDNLMMPEDDIEKMFAIDKIQNDAKTVPQTVIATPTTTTTTVTAATDIVAGDTDITSHNHKDITGVSNKVSGNNNNNNNNNICKGNSALACAFAAGIQNVAVAASQVLSAGVDGSNKNSSMTATTTTATIMPLADEFNAAAAAATVAAVDCVSAGANSDGDNTEMRKIETTSAAAAAAAAATNNRHSNESGFVSMKSFRTSTQSVSKRSSDYSFQSSTKSSSSNSEIAFGINQENAASASATTTASASTSITNAMSSTNNSEFHYQQQQIQSTATTTTTIASSSSAATSSSSTTRQLFTTSNTCGIASLSGLENAPDLLLSHLQQQQELLHGDEQQQQPPPPPALPPKMLRQGGRLSQYDNYDDIDDSGEIAELRHPLMQYALEQTQQQQQQIYQWQSKHQSLIEPRSNISLAGSCTAISSSGMDRQLDEPPPLPMKKKHILAYMEICSASTRSIEQHRHTMHSYNVTRNITHSQTMNIVPLTKELSPERETPPALPPKNYKPRKATTTPPTIITTPPPSPKPTHLSTDPYNNDTAGRVHGRVLSNSQPSGELMTTVCEEHSTDVLVEDDAATSRGISIDADADGDGNGDGSVRVDREGDGDGDGGVGGLGSSSSNISTDASNAQVHFHSHHLPNESACGGVSPSSTGSVNAVADGASGGKSPLMRVNNATNSNERTPICTPDLANDEDEGIDIILDNHKYRKEPHPTHVQLPNMLEEIDITPYLIFKKDSEDGPEVKGGYIDALIVHASRVQKVADNAFSEAFITTFRTFIQPIDVIEKLTHRYTVFFCQVNDQKQKAAKETFSLLVRVVNDLTSTDLTSQLLTLLVEFVFQLVCSGQLYLAKLLRNKFVEKVTLYKDQKVQNFQADMFVTVTNQPSLLDLKSLEIAEQMTLLDAELFQKIEIPEVLLFAKEQCEEKSPNLNKFTEHFNKMSYWARSKILMLSDAKEREKHVIKFIKIMKHLRKMNNYNSYLALLSALDSAPIRRLEWHKTITEGLKEYCTLIDSSSSFRVYRQALAETNPPCIPYIGLVLQDLTFVHVGNQDYLTKGVINFSKRWQQYNIIVNMKRFKKCSYPFRRNERIIRFFENFENFLGEEEMWQISETIKPRGKRPANNY